MTFSFPTQPTTYKQLIARSFSLYRLSLSHVFALSLMLSIIAFIPRLLSDFIGQDLFANIQIFSLSRLWLLLLDICCLIFFTAILWRIHCVITHSHETIIDDMKIALKKVPYIFIATVLQTLLIATLILCFVIFSFYFVFHQHLTIAIDIKSELITGSLMLAQLMVVAYIFFGFYFYLPIIAIENKGILTSLRKSFSLTWNHWWRTFSVQMTPWVAYTAALVAIHFILGLKIHIYFIKTGQQTLLLTGAHILAFAIFIPWVASMLLVQLNDLELRKKTLTAQT